MSELRQFVPPGPEPVRAALAFAPSLLSVPALPALLGVDTVIRVGSDRVGVREAFVLCDGTSGDVSRARAHALRRGLPVLRIRAGYLGAHRTEGSYSGSLSFVVEDIGRHDDPATMSGLEALLGSDLPWDRESASRAILSRARRAIDAMIEGRISRYDDAPDRVLSNAGHGDARRILVVDGSEETLRSALRENPEAKIYAWSERVLHRASRGALEKPADPRVRVVTAPTHPASLLDQVDHVYTTTSHLGFEALMRGKPVTLFGTPFYAGWGLTDDRVPIPRRTRKRSLEEVFAAAYILGSRYLDPETGEPCEIERVIEHLALQRRFVEPEGRELFATGFSPWKQVFLPAFLGAPTNRIRFGSWYPNRPLPPPDPSRRIVVWGVREDEIIAKRGVSDDIYRMEDGFLRSVGLGSDAHAPASLVVDSRGVYFDPTRPSDLEHMLETATFTPDELARAAKLRETIVALNVSKYNVGTLEPLRLPPSAKGRRVIMAIGQVEDDASIQRGCIDVRKNGDLLAAVREKNPDAFLIYKPHPDVTSGNRQGHVPESVTKKLCDMVVVDVGVGACLAVVDEVHTLTSLVGFEALLRGLHVSVYGHPFYAGWGLTDDRHPHPRRTRKRTLDELVAATLIRYPRYVHPRTGLFTTPEAIVRDLVEQRAKAAPPGPFEHAWIVRRGRKLLYILSRGRHGR